MLKGIRRGGKEALLRHRPGWFWAYVKWRHGFLEPEMALLPTLCRRDQVSIDVGANYGIYSYYLSKYSSRCIAFEPYPALASILRQGLSSRVEVHEVALSDRAGSTELRAVPDTTGLNTIEPTNPLSEQITGADEIKLFQVEVVRLDDLAINNVGFIKIDVQGHEEEVLRGGESTLRAYKPSILVELEEQHRAGSRESVSRLLISLGYQGFYLAKGALRPISGFDPSRLQNLARPDEYIRNFVFLPEHRLADFAPMIERS